MKSPQHMSGPQSPAARIEAMDMGGGDIFIPLGTRSRNEAGHDYVAEEWVAEGLDDLGLPYRTQIFIRRPQSMARFSGVVIVETLHGDGIAPIYMYSSPWIIREGHAWVCVASQKTALEEHIRVKNAVRYGEFSIGTDYPDPLPPRPDLGGPVDELADYVALMARINRASSEILAQVGRALRLPDGPFGERVSGLFLAGHCQTGSVVTDYIDAAQRLPSDSPIYDGYFPAGFPRDAFGPRDVPLVQVICDGDAFDTSARLLRADNPGRHYRRDDSDALSDRFRLYELAGFPHYGTRYPPFSDPSFSVPRQRGLIKPADTMNSLPYEALICVALDHLVKWATLGQVPPRAARIETTQGGRHFAKDRHGNSIGGVRCVQMDVPRAKYNPVPLTCEGVPAWATVGTEQAFEPEVMRELYEGPERYRALFRERLNDLISEGWLLAEDAVNMLEEADLQHW